MNRNSFYAYISRPLSLGFFALFFCQSVYANNLKELEIKSWTVELDRLHGVEEEVIQHITKNNRYDSLGYSILSHINLRRYTSNPNNIEQIKQAYQHAIHANILDKKYDYGKAALANVLYLQTSFDGAFTTLTQKSTQKKTWRSEFTLLRISQDKIDPQSLIQSTEDLLGKYNAPRSIIYPYVITQLSEKLDPEATNELLKKWQTKYPHITLDHGYALFSMDKGFYENSDRLFKKTRAKDPQNFDYALNHAVLLYKFLKKHKEAEEIMISISRLETNEHRKNILAFNYGLLCLEQNDDSGAQRKFKQLYTQTNMDRSFVQSIYNRYQSKNKLEQFATMMFDYSKEVRGYGWVYGFLGEIHLQDLKQPTKALQSLHNAVAIEPKNWKYHSNLGLALYQTQKVQGALDSFSTATNLNPNDSISHYNKACMLSILNRNEDAITSLKEAFEIDDSLVVSASKDTDLKNVHQDGLFLKLIEQYKVAH